MSPVDDDDTCEHGVSLDEDCDACDELDDEELDDDDELDDDEPC